MKINSIGQMSSGSVGYVNNNDEAAIRKQIQSLRKEHSKRTLQIRTNVQLNC